MDDTYASSDGGRVISSVHVQKKRALNAKSAATTGSLDPPRDRQHEPFW
jgi:hypothetical protein